MRRSNHFTHEEPEFTLIGEQVEELGFWLLHIEMKRWDKATLKKLREASVLVKSELGELRADRMDEKNEKFLRLIGFTKTDEWHICIETGMAYNLWRF